MRCDIAIYVSDISGSFFCVDIFAFANIIVPLQS